MPGIIYNPGQIVWVARVGQQIKVHYAGRIAGAYRMDKKFELIKSALQVTSQDTSMKVSDYVGISKNA